jgi:hypothetical protein
VRVTPRAKEALGRNFSGAADGKGYVRWPRDNLLPGIDLGAEHECAICIEEGRLARAVPVVGW